MKSAVEVLKQSDYIKLLGTKEWALFSSSVRSSRSNTCECCRLGDRQTQVHHIFYVAGLKPWEHDQQDVVLLCKSCHEQLHEELKKFRKFVFRKMTPQILRTINGALAVGFEQYNPLVFAHAVAELAANPGMVKRFSEYWNKP